MTVFVIFTKSMKIYYLVHFVGFRAMLGLLFFAVFPSTGYAQDTLNFNDLIVSSKGKTAKIKYKSDLTGSKQILLLKTGTWLYYDEFGNVIKTAGYAIDNYNVSVLHGATSYFHPEGYELLTMKYDRNQLVSSKAFNTVLLFDGLRTIEITEQLGAYTIAEYGTKQGNPAPKSKIVKPNPNDMPFYQAYENKHGDTNLLMLQSFPANHKSNHISNPMIENHPKIYHSFNGIGEVIPGWSDASPSPDFFMTRTAFSGDACLGFRPYSYGNDIEYLRNELVQPLKKDSFYCFSMKILLAPHCSYVTNRLAANFSSTEKIQNKKGEWIGPQLIFENAMLLYKSTWMTLQCIYKASGGEKYVTLGSFKRVDDMVVERIKGQKDETYYYLDDVSLVPISDPKKCPCTRKELIDTVANPPKYAPGKSFVLNGVFFENDKDVLLPISVDSLNKLVALLLEHPSWIIEIAGHTSLVGGYDHNMDLSDRRAMSVKKFLVKAGIEPDRLVTKGYGPTMPIADNKTDEGQALNRRVEVRILKM